MVLWQMFVIAAIVAIVLEMVLPSMFFLNFAIAGVITALISLFVHDANMLIIDFIIISILSIVILRPLLMRTLKKTKDTETGVNADYIGKIVRVIEPVSKYKGVITIYDERWEARVENDDEIPVGTEVRIVKNDSLIMFVERI